MDKKLRKAVVQLPKGLQIGFNISTPVMIISTKEFNLLRTAVDTMANDYLGFEAMKNREDFRIIELGAQISETLSCFMVQFNEYIKDEEILTYYWKVIKDVSDRRTGILNLILTDKPFIACAMTNTQLSALKLREDCNLISSGKWK